jgi:serine/threonine-protein phosphatase 2A regulatory subunit B'
VLTTMGAEVVPRARKSTTLRFLFELEKPDGLLPGTAKLPPPTPEPEVDSLIAKIAACNRVFTFADDAERVEERDAKAERLGEVLAAVRSQKQPLDHRVMVALVKMVGANLFRTLPPSAYPPLPPDGIDEDAPVTVLAAAWPHLQVVYDVLLAFVTAADARTLRNHVGRAFLSGLLTLFASEDPRERDRLKTAYHQLYAKLTCERAFMRRSMAVALLRFVHEPAGPAEQQQRGCCGVAELLEVCGSIVSGFAVPLKPEHRAFLARVLLPLHRTRWVHAYHRQLAYCVLQFVHKEPDLADPVVRGILRCWPVTNCQRRFSNSSSRSSSRTSPCPSARGLRDASVAAALRFLLFSATTRPIFSMLFIIRLRSVLPVGNIYDGFVSSITTYSRCLLIIFLFGFRILD